MSPDVIVKHFDILNQKRFGLAMAGKHIPKHQFSFQRTKETFSYGISIKERPSEIEDRVVPGHWEGDLVAGSRNSNIATLVERVSRFIMLIKVEGKDAISVTKALSEQIKKLPGDLRQSLTWDRGMELAHHHEFTVATNVKVYFCDPKSPWQRGTNENTNGLIRQYFLKKTDLSLHSQEDLEFIASQMNQQCCVDRLNLQQHFLGFPAPYAAAYSHVPNA